MVAWIGVASRRQFRRRRSRYAGVRLGKIDDVVLVGKGSRRFSRSRASYPIRLQSQRFPSVMRRRGNFRPVRVASSLATMRTPDGARRGVLRSGLRQSAGRENELRAAWRFHQRSARRVDRSLPKSAGVVALNAYGALDGRWGSPRTIRQYRGGRPLVTRCKLHATKYQLVT